jgi:endonuclease/exonuclease/phosphatase family metal-dependent hydrolase
MKILTYNIHRAIGVDRRFRPDRIAEIVNHHDPDVALLQEVDEGVPRSRELHLAKELAAAMGYPHFAVGHNVSMRKGRYGNATLSRFPIVRERNIDLTIEGRKRRGCQHTTLLVNGTLGQRVELEVFNLHLGLSAQERARQVGILVRSAEFANTDLSHPCIVGGDFNDWRSLLHPIFTEILGFGCCTQKPTTYEVGIRTYPSFSPQGGLDRIYYRGGLKPQGTRACRLRLSKVASDHLPVISDLELGPAAVPSHG